MESVRGAKSTGGAAEEMKVAHEVVQVAAAAAQEEVVEVEVKK
jgi:hypothetical protein